MNSILNEFTNACCNKSIMFYRGSPVSTILISTMGQDPLKCKETFSKLMSLILVLMYPYGSLEVPLVPKSQNTLELFKFTRYRGSPDSTVFAPPGNGTIGENLTNQAETFRFSNSLFLLTFTRIFKIF
jgi:hypothetical protein